MVHLTASQKSGWKYLLMSSGAIFPLKNKSVLTCMQIVLTHYETALFWVYTVWDRGFWNSTADDKAEDCERVKLLR